MTAHPRPTPTLELIDPPATVYDETFTMGGVNYRPSTDYGVLVHWPNGTIGGSDAWSDANGNLAFSAYAYFHGDYTVEIQDRRHDAIVASVSFSVS